MALNGRHGIAPQITVVITNYNYGRFLRGSIESVLTQTADGVECIVVDDGSTDDSRVILGEFGSRVQTYFQQNQGQAAALREGARLARSAIIISLDADDLLYPNTCARVIAAFAPDVSCVSYRLDVYQGDTRMGTTLPAQPFLVDGHLRYLERFGFYPSPPMSGNAFATDYLRTFLARAMHLDGDGVDAYLLYSAPVFGRVVPIDEALGGYRMHGGNVSMSSGRKTVKNLGDHIYYQYWAERNAAHFAAERAIPYTSNGFLKGPYLLLWYLFVRDGDYSRWALPRQGRMMTTLLCARAFLTFPDLTLKSRVKNLALVAALALSPRALRLKIERRLVDFD